MKVKRLLKRGLVGLLVLFAVIQLLPYGRAHTNPASRGRPPWDSLEVEALARRACFDCHSNETRWPWYSHIAPASWLLQKDVEDGRRHLNFSEWDLPQRKADDAAEEVREKEMPPWFYLPMHGEARLTDAERDTLARGLERLATAKAR